MTHSPVLQTSAWDELSSAQAFAELFGAKFAKSLGHGIDRVGAVAFRERLTDECGILARKVCAGTYQFTPYMERLVTKGRHKPPRVISVPSLRDRLLLHQLKEYLHDQVPSVVRRSLPNEYIRALNACLSGNPAPSTSFVRADIKAFYDCIAHSPLVDTLTRELPDNRVTNLIKRAVTTETVPMGYNRPRGGATRPRVGVPQGLAISNVLANLYLAGVDELMQSQCILYLRYVDDILMIVPRGEETAARIRLETALAGIGLELNDDKSCTGDLAATFEYLGYRVSWPRISVRRSTVEKYLRAVAAMITNYRYRVRENRLPKYLSPLSRRAAFIDELNDTITGAISGVRRYGWLFYFSEINDRHLLHSMDRSIALMLRQVGEFGDGPPKELKRLARAFYEVRFSPDGGYIRNYNTLAGIVDRLAFLIRRGRVDPEDADRMSEQEVNSLFDAYREEQLSRFDSDIGHIS